MSEAGFLTGVEPRFLDVHVRPLPALTGFRFPIAARWGARCDEDRASYGGSGDTPLNALADLARACARARPSWVRDDHALEVVVIGAHPHAIAGRGATLGDAVLDAATVLSAITRTDLEERARDIDEAVREALA